MTNEKKFVFGDSRLPERFWSKVSAAPSGCWLWKANKNSGGYGQIRFGGRQMVSAHRLAFATLVGEIPAGLQLDHLCRVRHCCNPHHLEPVTSAENTRRGQGPSAVNAAKKNCPQGHPYDGENLHIRPNGKRKCRACDRIRRKARYAATRDASAAWQREYYAKNREVILARKRSSRSDKPRTEVSAS
ncbi:HNH endonuclease signature motif containing protein [Streptomyces badius]